MQVQQLTLRVFVNALHHLQERDCSKTLRATGSKQAQPWRHMLPLLHCTCPLMQAHLELPLAAHGDDHAAAWLQLVDEHIRK